MHALSLHSLHSMSFKSILWSKYTVEMISKDVHKYFITLLCWIYNKQLFFPELWLTWTPVKDTGVSSVERYVLLLLHCVTAVQYMNALFTKYIILFVFCACLTSYSRHLYQKHVWWHNILLTFSYHTLFLLVAAATWPLAFRFYWRIVETSSKSINK